MCMQMRTGCRCGGKHKSRTNTSMSSVMPSAIYKELERSVLMTAQDDKVPKLMLLC